MNNLAGQRNNKVKERKHLSFVHFPTYLRDDVKNKCSRVYNPPSKFVMNIMGELKNYLKIKR